jgi:hypothetical protein
MPQVKSTADVKALMETKKGGIKPIIFGAEIEKLKKEEGLFIGEEEWNIKATPAAYYYAKYRKGKETRTISISKVEGGHLITKL